MSCRAALTAVLIMAGAPAGADALPTRVGACVVTAIESVETRLADGATHQPMPGSGGAVRFANGGYQVSYDTVPAIEESRKCDRVRMCFVSTPLNCPKGDDRGEIYNSANPRTHKNWRLPDSERSRGGA